MDYYGIYDIHYCGWSGGGRVGCRFLQQYNFSEETIDNLRDFHRNYFNIYCIKYYFSIYEQRKRQSQQTFQRTARSMETSVHDSVSAPDNICTESHILDIPDISVLFCAYEAELS